MKMSGEQIIPAPRARVWEALNDPEVLRQSIPGCNEMVKHSATEFTAKVQAKVGPVKANFAGDVTLSRLNPPESYLISGQGTGGAAGFAEGGAEVRLEEVGDNTRLIYDVDAKVGGKLAQIGSRLIDSTARKMADDFFKRFAEAVAGDAPKAAADPVKEAEAPAEPAAAAAPAQPRKAAAKKAPGKKSPAKKAAAKKAPAKKTAATRASARPNGRSRGEAVEPTKSAAEVSPAPSLMPEAVVAASASKPDEPQPAAQQPLAGNNLWWLVGAAVVALLVILVLATV